MPRFFVEKIIDDRSDLMRMTGADFHHIRDVLRMKPGQQLVVCDGARIDLHSEIEQYNESAVVLRIIKRVSNQTEPPYEAVLYQGLAKGDKMETIIQKAVELGVSRVIPMICRRSVARIDPKSAERKLVRWNRIAAEAAKQCCRGRLPRVEQPVAFAAAVGQAAAADLALIPWESERTLSIREALEQADRMNDDPVVSILIGPEGGFDASEIDLAIKNNLAAVSLGPRILRTETAGLAALSMLVYHFNDF